MVRLWSEMSNPRRFPPRQRRLPRAETRQRLLDAAASVFAELGYDAATLEEVAASAGFSKGAVYSNFASKQELFLALMRERVDQRLSAVAINPAETPTGFAEGAGHALVTLLREQPEWHRLFIEFWVRAMHDPELRAELSQQRRLIRRDIARQIDEHAARLGIELPAPSEDLTIMILGLSNGLAIEHLADPETVDPHVLADGLRLLLRDQQQSS